MVHRILLYQPKPEITQANLEEIMMATRMQLLKIPEILSVKCGKTVEADSKWPYFIALDFESLEKATMTEEDAIYLKFMSETIQPSMADRLTLSYEMEPGKNVKYS